MLKLLATVVVLQFAHINGFKIQPKIIDGILGDVSEFPFFVKLDLADDVCSGTLISDRYIYKKQQPHTACVTS